MSPKINTFMSSLELKVHVIEPSQIIIILSKCKYYLGNVITIWGLLYVYIN